MAITDITSYSIEVPEWTLGDRLRKARRRAGLKQEEMAVALGVTANCYGNWEADNNGPRDLVGVARRVEELTGTPADWTLGLRTGSFTDSAGLPFVATDLALADAS